MILTSIDYFSGTGFFNSIIEVERFINEISQLMNPKNEYYIEEQEIRIGEKFTSRIGSVFKMYGGTRATNGRVKLILQLPGSFCKRIENQKEAIKFLSENLKATRIDIALDDYDRRINQSAIDKLGQLGHYKGVERYELISSKTAQDSEKEQTCYFGSALKSIRFYNAEAVHGFPADRWELQARGEYAEQITNVLNEIDSDNLPKTMGGFVTHAIDFIQRGETWRHETRYQFWKELREQCDRAKLKGPNKESSIEKINKWFNKQICPSQAIYYLGFGKENYLELMENFALEGEKRLNKHQKAIITYLQRTDEKTNLGLTKKEELL